jgi:hypothetical protein
MSDIHKRLEEYLNEEEVLDEFLPSEDVEMMEMMADFIMNLDSDSMTEDQKKEAAELIDLLSDGN